VAAGRGGGGYFSLSSVDQCWSISRAKHLLIISLAHLQMRTLRHRCHEEVDFHSLKWGYHPESEQNGRSK
jgi:hypothetical protein